MRITFEIEDAGEDLVAIFHSHTRSPAVPSATDRRTALYPDRPFYLLATPGRPDAPPGRALRAWRIHGGQTFEVPLHSATCDGPPHRRGYGRSGGRALHHGTAGREIDDHVEPGRPLLAAGAEGGEEPAAARRQLPARAAAYASREPIAAAGTPSRANRSMVGSSPDG